MKKLLSDLYVAKPFKNRNADNYDLSQILDLFVPPSQGLENPFEYENAIVRGRMGSGKTMYLKANYAYYLYQMVPSILYQQQLIIPVTIRFNDFQHLAKPEDIYREIIIRIVEEVCGAYERLFDADKMVHIHKGMRGVSSEYHKGQLADVMKNLISLRAEEYTETISKEFKSGGSLKHSFIAACAEYKKTTGLEIKTKKQPGISDVRDAYEKLLAGRNGKILLLMDEAGSLNRSFYNRETDKENSFFEILMNQLRTSDYIRTKVAVYPHSFQDILAETRYGDLVNLIEDVSDDTGYKKFWQKAVSLISKYIHTASDGKIKGDDLFDLSDEQMFGGTLEQIINASDGNIRRLVQLLDKSMTAAYSDHCGKAMVSRDHVSAALKRSAQSMLDLYIDTEKEFLDDISKVCKSRKTFKFQFPYKSPALSKYTSKSEESNILKVVQIGTGQRGTTYSFDYTYCVLKDIPTHYIKSTEGIDKDRSMKTGDWVTRTANISETLIEQAKLPGKIEGNIIYNAGSSGFIKGDNSTEYFFNADMLLEDAKDKKLAVGRRCRFYPMPSGDSNTQYAYLLELI